MQRARLRDEEMSVFMRDQIERKWGDGEFASSVSHVSALATLREMPIPEPPEEGAGRGNEQVLRRQAAALLHLTEALSIDTYAGPDAAPATAAPGGHALRLARLWEYIARLEGPSSSGHSLLNAASLYDLAGYQANATCLSRRFDRRHGGRGSDLSRIVSALLQRQFAKLRHDCLPLTREPDYEAVQDMPHALGMAVAAKAVLSLGGYFLSGSRAQLDEARSGLGVAESLFAESGLYHESSLMHSVRSMSGPMAQRSLWSVLVDQGKEDFAWTRYAMLLARGPGQAGEGTVRPVSEVWPSQREAIERGLLDSGSSLIVRMPTSSGKTRIAEMAILNALTTPEGGDGGAVKCVYVAPYRALVAEVTGSLSGIFADLGYTVSGMDGSYNDDPFDDYAVEGSDILVTTPEKLDLLIRTRRGRLDGASLFVFDEGHAVGSGRRGLKMELLLTRLATQFPRSRLIVLSAMISDESIREFAQWLCGGRRAEGGNTITSGWSPTIQRRARFVWPPAAGAGATLVFDKREGDPLSGRIVKEIAHRRTYEYVNEETGRTNRERFPSSDKGSSAAELAFMYSEAGPVLVYATTKKSVMSIGSKLDRRIRLARLAGDDVPRHFLADPAARPKSLQIAHDWLGNDHEVSRLLARGIAVHHADVPDTLKRSIEDDVRAGAYRVIVATNTLSQGVNMPVRTVIIHSSRRYDKRADRAVPIPASEYWNLAGRAGRAGHETEGLVIHIVASAADKRDYNWYGEGRGHDKVRSHMHSLLDDLVNERMSGEDLEDVVDSDVLGMLAEESVRGGCEDAVGRLLSGTLAAEQMRAESSGKKMEIARDLFRSVAKNAADLGRNLSVYACTGLGSHSCRAISEYVQANREEAGRLMSSAESSEDVTRLALLALGVIERLPEMSPGQAYGGDREALVRGWIAGDAVPDILGAVPAGDRAKAAQFVERFLGHYMPWGMSAFVRIAAAELGIEDDRMPPGARYASEMVRHGVPSPEAGWAVRLGAATRQSAMRIATDYAGERTVRAFARWLAGLGARGLARYGGGPAAAALASSRAAGPNPLVRGGYTLDRVLGMGASVRCVENGSGPAAAARLSSGDPLDLVRDHDMAYDRNAIAVYADGSLIGHMERNVAGYLAPLIDCGTRITARADGLAGGPRGPDSIKVTLQADGEPGAGRR